MVNQWPKKISGRSDSPYLMTGLTLSWLCIMGIGQQCVMAGQVITHDLYPLPHSLEILESCCPPSSSDISQISEFQSDEDIGPYLDTLEMVFCSQHHAECKCLG